MSACCLTVWAKSITEGSVLRIRPEGWAMMVDWLPGLNRLREKGCLRAKLGGKFCRG
jgi:hypothetical protein